VSSSEPSGRACFLLFFILFSFISSCQPSTNEFAFAAASRCRKRPASDNGRTYPAR
jgi:hypothetical protein